MDAQRLRGIPALPSVTRGQVKNIRAHLHGIARRRERARAMRFTLTGSDTRSVTVVTV